MSAASVNSPMSASYVIVDELQDDDEARERLAGAYVYVRTGAQAGAQRRIMQRGYDGPNGAVLVSRQFDLPLEEGVRVEISKPLPVRRHLDRKGLLNLLEEAAESVVVDARLALTGNGTRSISLASYPWLRSKEQTRGIYHSQLGVPTGEPNVLSYGPYRFAVDGVGVSLVPSTIYGSTETFDLAVAVQGNRLLYDGAAWDYVEAETIVETAADTWQVAMPEHWIRVFGVMRGLQHLITLTLQDPTITDDTVRKNRVAEYSRRLTPFARAAFEIQVAEFSPPVQESGDGMVESAGSGDWLPESPYGSELTRV